MKYTYKMEKTKTVLVIGNGFDIAHGLPTKYTDFLEFISDDYKSSKVYELVPKEDVDIVREKILTVLGSDNHLLSFIQEKHKEHLISGENWVDFEQEISKIVRYIERKVYGKDTELDKMIEREFDSLSFLFDSENSSSDIKLFHENFYRLLCVFEMYVTEIINKIESKYFCEEIGSLRPDLIISLNYSNTYERVYSRFRKVDYVHGKAHLNGVEFPKDRESLDAEDYRDSNHIILGIDEYLEDEEIKDRTDFISFRKYFQRIIKGTGIEYKKHLGADRLNVFVFGHSLDPTDKELLEEIIGNKKAKVTIFYHDESSHISQVTNLVRVFGKDAVIDKCHGENPVISFRRQKESMLIKDNENFSLQRSIEYLNHFTRLTPDEFKRQLNVVTCCINNGRGFATQLDTIRAYDTIRTFNFDAEYKDRLLEIAGMVPAVNDNDQIVNAFIYNEEDWIEGTAWGTGEVHRKMSQFISDINTINAKRAKKDGVVVVRSDDHFIHTYEKKIPGEIKQDDYAAFVIKMAGMLSVGGDPDRIWSLLKRVTVSDGNTSAQIELERLKTKRRDSDFIIAVCNYLENYIDECAAAEAYDEWLRENNYYENLNEGSEP